MYKYAKTYYKNVQIFSNFQEALKFLKINKKTIIPHLIFVNLEIDESIIVSINYYNNENFKKLNSFYNSK